MAMATQSRENCCPFIFRFAGRRRSRVRNDHRPRSIHSSLIPISKRTLAAKRIVCFLLSCVIGFHIHIFQIVAARTAPPVPFSGEETLRFRIGSAKSFYGLTYVYGRILLPLRAPMICTKSELSKIVSLCDPLREAVYKNIRFGRQGALPFVFFVTGQVQHRTSPTDPVLKTLEEQFPHLHFELRTAQVSYWLADHQEHVITVRRREWYF